MKRSDQVLIRSSWERCSVYAAENKRPTDSEWRLFAVWLLEEPHQRLISGLWLPSPFVHRKSKHHELSLCRIRFVREIQNRWMIDCSKELELGRKHKKNSPDCNGTVELFLSGVPEKNLITKQSEPHHFLPHLLINRLNRLLFDWSVVI